MTLDDFSWTDTYRKPTPWVVLAVRLVVKIGSVDDSCGGGGDPKLSI